MPLSVSPMSPDPRWAALFCRRGLLHTRSGPGIAVAPCVWRWVPAIEPLRVWRCREVGEPVPYIPLSAAWVWRVNYVVWAFSLAVLEASSLRVGFVIRASKCILLYPDPGHPNPQCCRVRGILYDHVIKMHIPMGTYSPRGDLPVDIMSSGEGWYR